jgi:hypothetical protein
MRQKLRRLIPLMVLVGFAASVPLVGGGLAAGGSATTRPSDPPPASVLSCPTVTFCAVIDGSAVATYSHGVWSHRQDITRGTGDGLNDVSCPTASFCMAVAGNLVGGGGSYRYTHGKWSKEPRFNDDTYGQDAVSCASATSCVSVGWGEMYEYRNGTWSKGTQLGGIAGPISCPAATRCLWLQADRGNDITAFTYPGDPSSRGWSIGRAPAPPPPT